MNMEKWVLLPIQNRLGGLERRRCEITTWKEAAPRRAVATAARLAAEEDSAN